uniref:DUF2867 domain-containing protein n=1 Tax=uncultured Sphingomonas sp. TaxID=158754 RepID=UPI0035CB2243
MHKAYPVPPPRESVLESLYADADLIDAFAIALPAGAPDDIGVLTRALWGGRSPWWVRSLMATRDAVVALVGIKTSRQIGAAAAARGAVIGFFPVVSQSASELIVGANDRHLDFRAATLVRAGADGGRELVVVSVVHCHNALGRTYLWGIGPFHRVIVRATLERAVRSLSSDA